jgi:hypothetical protein
MSWLLHKPDAQRALPMAHQRLVHAPLNKALSMLPPKIDPVFLLSD